jgi:hypothetical protein
VTDGDSLAGQHIARVIVNRLWQQVFGRGIVAPSDNFGVSGSLPTHPELLDWLAAEFLRRGWRAKPLIKTMLLSSAYQQQSTVGKAAAQAAKIDPENELLSRMNLRRLESEQVRDAILTVSGKLDRSLGGPSLALDVRPDGMVVIKEDGLPTPTSKWRRSVYVLARRNYHLTMLRLFDQPFVTRNCAVRQPSAVVTQSLALLHDDFVIEQAGFLAERAAGAVADDSVAARIDVAFQIALGRPADETERKWSEQLIERQRERSQNDQQALTQLCHVLLNTNEFLYVK